MNEDKHKERLAERYKEIQTHTKNDGGSKERRRRRHALLWTISMATNPKLTDDCFIAS